MYKKITGVVLATVVLACNSEQKTSQFTVRGEIKNNTARMLYLEKVAPATMETVITDSVLIGKDGNFELKSENSESVVYNLRLDQNQYPIVSLINDVDDIELAITLSPENNEFTESYEVKGSKASAAMKDYVVSINKELQSLFQVLQQADTLQKAGAPDSVVAPLMMQHRELTGRISTMTQQELDRAADPALVLFVLGYYQSTANAAGFGLQPLTDEQVNAALDKTAAKFPNHQSLAKIRGQLAEEKVKREQVFSWVGKTAPDFSMPDVNGKEVSLSSFKGKYVLVDFWASWCKPCRDENPTVVAAYNKYKDKNFTVLGVSLDRPGQKEQWVKAIKDDRLSWTNISDLQYWNSPVIPLYRIEGIPFNVLVDPQGNIVAENLRGPMLDATLAGLKM